MTGTVKIGCRIPAGVALRAHEWFDGPDGEPQLREVGRFDLAGSRAHIGAAPGGLLAEEDAAFTEVDGDLWSKWLKLNEGCDLLTSGAVFKGNASAEVASEPAADPVQAEADAQPKATDDAGSVKGSAVGKKRGA